MTDQTGDRASIKQQRKLAKATARDLRKWISQQWALQGESTFTDSRTGRSLRMTREIFDCGEVITVSNLEEDGGPHVDESERNSNKPASEIIPAGDVACRGS